MNTQNTLSMIPVVERSTGKITVVLGCMVAELLASKTRSGQPRYRKAKRNEFKDCDNLKIYG